MSIYALITFRIELAVKFATIKSTGILIQALGMVRHKR